MIFSHVLYQLSYLGNTRADKLTVPGTVGLVRGSPDV